MKKFLIIPFLLISFFAFSQTHQTVLTYRAQNTPTNSKDSLAYSFDGKIGNYSYLGNLELMRSLFKLKMDSVSNSGYVTHGYFNAHTGSAPITTLNNGLTLSGTTGKLGGTLSSSTHISTNGWPFFIQDASTDLQFLFSTPGNQVTLQSQSNGVGVDVLSGGTYGRSYLRYVTGGGDSTYFGVNVNNSTGHGGLIVADQVWNVGPIADASIDTAKISLNPRAYVTNDWVIGHLGSGGGALTDGNGTTADGTAVDLGGVATANIGLLVSGHTFDIYADSFQTDLSVSDGSISMNAQDSSGLGGNSTVNNHQAALGYSGTGGKVKRLDFGDARGTLGMWVDDDIDSRGFRYSKHMNYSGTGISGQQIPDRQLIDSLITVAVPSPTAVLTKTGTQPVSNKTFLPANTYQTGAGTAGTDSLVVKSAGALKAIAAGYYQVAGSYQPLEDQRLSTTNSPSFVKQLITGTGGGGYDDLISQSASPSSLAGHIRIYADSLNRFAWKNSTYRRTIQVPYPSDYTIRMPYQVTGTTLADSAQVATALNNAILGQDFKEAVQYTTSAALPSVVYNNGTSGVGATLTGVGFGAITIDGATPAVTNRVLVKNQVSTFQNGAYTVTTVGTGGTVFVLTRATDFNQSAEIKTGSSVFTTLGNANSLTTWAVNSGDNPVMGTDPITFAQVAGQGSFVNGNGISITGNSIAINTAVTADKTTAQVLTNKDLTDATNSFPTTLLTKTGTQPVSNKTLLPANTYQTGTGTAGTDSLVVKNAGTLKAIPANYYQVTGADPFITTLSALGSPIKGYPALAPGPGISSNAMNSGVLYLEAVYVPAAVTLTGVGVIVQTTGVYTGNNENRVGLYTFSGGTATLVASSSNNLTLWTASPGWLQIPFSGTYSAAAGTYYVGIVYSQSAQTTAPALVNNQQSTTANTISTLGQTNSNRLSGNKTSQTTLPSSITMSTVSSASPHYITVY